MFTTYIIYLFFRFIITVCVGGLDKKESGGGAFSTCNQQQEEKGDGERIFITRVQSKEKGAGETERPTKKKNPPATASNSDGKT